MPAPILLFTYNRPKHTKLTLEALMNNTLASSSLLIVYSDGPKNERDIKPIEEVRSLVDHLTGFKKVSLIKSDKNKGLARSIIGGVSEQLEIHKEVIVLEDDLITSSDFLEFMNQALDYYRTKKVMSISGYIPPIETNDSQNNISVFLPRISSWGWAIWLDRWKQIDWEISDFNTFIRNKLEIKKFNAGGEDCTAMLLKQILGKIDSWAIRFNYAAYKLNLPTVYPSKTKINNIGIDSSGTHMRKSFKRFQNNLDTNKVIFTNIQDNRMVLSSFQKFHKTSWYRKIKNCILRWQYMKNL